MVNASYFACFIHKASSHAIIIQRIQTIQKNCNDANTAEPNNGDLLNDSKFLDQQSLQYRY